MQRVSSVEKVSVSIAKSNPPKTSISAAGTVPTSGWTDPTLGPWFYIKPPKDGILDLDFYAEEPNGVVLTVLSPISAHVTIERDPAHFWGKDQPLVGVRVHAATNFVEGKLSESDDTLLLFSFGDGDPYPLVRKRKIDAIVGKRIPTEAALTELLGKTVRVYHTGDILTLDHRLDRANIELSPSSHLIVDVWFG